MAPELDAFTREMGLESDDLTWVMPAVQKRSRETLQKILRTTLQLLNEKSFDEITISEICRGARCTAPSFYQRFRDKEALLHVIHEIFTADCLKIIREYVDPEQWAGKPVEHLVSSLIEAIFAMESRSGGLRTTAVRRSFNDEHFAKRIRGIRDELYNHLAGVLVQLDEQICVEDTNRAARFLVRLIQGAAARHFEGPHLESDPIDRDELAADLCSVALAHLGVSSDTAPSIPSPEI